MSSHDSAKTERLGTLLIVSGPSGTGKTTLCRQLLNAEPELHFSVSCTTRTPRAGEKDGMDYHFLSSEQFDRYVEQNAFLEHARVHDQYYGTLRSEVESRVFDGTDVLLDIDVQGARQVREAIRDTLLAETATFVFIGPPTIAEMARRLRGRGTDPEPVVERRLKNAEEELRAWREYDYLVVNDVLEQAFHGFRAVLDASRLRTARRQAGPPWEREQAQRNGTMP